MYGCNKTGANGWFRKQDRAVHQRKEHAGMDKTLLVSMNEDVDGRMPEYLARK
jgi:hypothetical protein